MASRRAFSPLVSSTRSATRPSHRSRPSFASTLTCAFSTTTPCRNAELDAEAIDRPRWQQTPPRMQAPFRTRPLPQGPVFRANEDPRKLDDAYIRMLGQGGDKVLTDEVKWLAVTHKSFDHGRRGFNDRLAFIGRRIVSLQTSQAILNAPQAESWPRDSEGQPMPDKHGRVPFTHPALNGLAGLSQEATDSVLDKSRLADIAERYGLDKVTRWKPKRADDLQGSGIDSVSTTTLYAIVGAIALERGGELANKVTQDRILTPLGFTFAEHAL